MCFGWVLLFCCCFLPFVAAYPFALSCFVLCALLFSPSPKSIPLHNLGTHSHHSLLSLSLSLYFCFFFSSSSSEVCLLFEFLWKDSCKVLFCKFLIGTQNQKEKKKQNKTKKFKRKSMFAASCWRFFFFFWVEIFFSKKKWVLLRFSCFTKFLDQNCHP